jgi:serine/threonine protein kinase/tetratricopeptide (TPR) repeat protein
VTDDALRQQLQSSLGTAYIIERELGGGGMSRVFLAAETSLGRQVVIKLLPPEMAASVSIERFKREIQLAARLQHPHIVPLLTAGDANGLPYFTMPFVDGESLRARLARRGEMPVAEALRVLREIASALAYAHERGVVHRDIKPDNVMLSGGSAMVTDFGVAKALSSSSNAEHGGVTSLGVALGTPAYMAPEQASADPNVDHRADVYAFGILAYELLTGQTPFGGRTPQGLLAAHVTEPPEPIQKRRPSLPPSLAALVMRCLEKRPADRPQSAAEIVHALDDVVTPSGGMAPTAAAVASSQHPTISTARRPRGVVFGIVAIVVVLIGAVAWQLRRPSAPSTSGDAVVSSLAVLPFENVGGDTSSAYFADGMTDELATALAKVPSLRVASRTSSYVFRKHEGLDASAIAGRLHVGAILEGTVRRAGKQLRVTAQLTRAVDGQSMWADAFTADAGDVFSVQERLTKSIVTAVAPTLAGRRVAAIVASDQGSRNPVAYDIYLRARYELNRRGDGVKGSIPLFEQAIARDSEFAPSWAGLASAWAVITDYEVSVDPAKAFPPARSAAERAMALDSTNGEAYTALGYALAKTGDMMRGEAQLRRGVDLESRSAIGRMWLATVALYLGRYDEAESTMREAMALDPLSGLVISNLALVLALDSAHWPEARDLARRAMSVDPGNGGSLANAVQALTETRDFAEALALARSAGLSAANNPYLRELIVMDLVALGRPDSAADVFRDMQREPASIKSSEMRAVAAAALGKWDWAFAAGDTVVRAEKSLDFLVETASAWSSKANDPRMRAMCAQSQMDCAQVIALVARTPPLR